MIFQLEAVETAGCEEKEKHVKSHFRLTCCIAPSMNTDDAVVCIDLAVRWKSRNLANVRGMDGTVAGYRRHTQMWRLTILCI